MKIKSFVFNPFMENTYVLHDESKEAYIIDPGCYESYERNEIVTYIADNQLTPKAIINTHCHIDHVLGNAYLSNHYSIPLWIPEGEKDLLEAVKVYAPNWGISNYEHKDADRLLKESDSIKLGNQELEILFAPGHAPGHFMFYHKEENTLIAGDVIFKQSIGRTDLPGGNHELLLESIREKVYTLPDHTVIYSGHGPTTIVGEEKLTNPFVRV